MSSSTIMFQRVPVPVFELCKNDGGQISQTAFGRLMSLLDSSGSLDHTHITPTSLNHSSGLPVSVILQRGDIPSAEFDSQGYPLYWSYRLYTGDHWLAGMCHLYFPDPKVRHTVNLVVSLLAPAREKGFGRAAVNKLIEHAFDVLRVHRLVAPIVCPAHPGDTEEDKKRAVHETKRLCWVFEQYGFKFEGISRGEVANPRVGSQKTPVWQDVYRMSMLETDYLAKQMSGLFSGSVSQKDVDCRHDPYESMLQRQEQEKRDMVVWGCAPVESGASAVADDEDDEGDEEDDYGSDDYEDPEDFDD